MYTGKQGKIGFLPLYVALYDAVWPELRSGMEEFACELEKALSAQGLSVEKAPVCRLREEFFDAVSAFERAEVDAIVTVHLAYSPSLESVDALSRTELPLIILDTTPEFSFGFDASADKINYNHGIHGVQELCNLLLRRKKPFSLEVGHWKESDVLSRIACRVRAAQMYHAMQSNRVGRIGGPFEGMGDFAVSDACLRALGLQVLEYEAAQSTTLLEKITEEELQAEYEANRRDFNLSLSTEQETAAVKTNLMIRKWMQEKRLTAFTMNFLAIRPELGLPTVPFLEAARAMERGDGYAGEGDVLTAGLVSAILKAYPRTSFGEMFSPDWAGGRVFVSHMGEMNPALAARRPRLLPKSFPFTEVTPPAAAIGSFCRGDALLVNLAPGVDEQLRLIVAPVQMENTEKENAMEGVISGWFTPECPLDKFLHAYSLVGGTHHLAIVYDAHPDAFESFAMLMGWDFTLL